MIEMSLKCCCKLHKILWTGQFVGGVAGWFVHQMRHIVLSHARLFTRSPRDRGINGRGKKSGMGGVWKRKEGALFASLDPCHRSIFVLRAFNQNICISNFSASELFFLTCLPRLTVVSIALISAGLETFSQPAIFCCTFASVQCHLRSTSDGSGQFIPTRGTYQPCFCDWSHDKHCFLALRRFATPQHTAIRHVLSRSNDQGQLPLGQGHFFPQWRPEMKMQTASRFSFIYCNLHTR